MQAKINGSYELGEGDDKKVYKRSDKEIKEEHCKGWFFDALVKDGSIVLLEGTGQDVPDENKTDTGSNDTGNTSDTSGNADNKTDEKPISRMNKTTLAEFAKEKGIVLEDGLTKAQMVDAIKTALEG
ncbi:MAG: hypothetical protein KAS30_01565 [Candidatus Diapherotrites archaeon]|nr:hypothetical protein [Candidatus Diapherotrites archaeon]